MACPITVNVYDMYWTNEYTSNLGLGVYHTGVVVYGVEYAYGGHQDPDSGVFGIEPGDVETLGPQFKFKQALSMGTTDFTQDEVVQIVQQLGNSFLGNQYHLLRKNCNHFTDALLKELSGLKLPPWINRLATVSSAIPFIERALPKAWLRPGVVEEDSTAATNGVSSTEHGNATGSGGGLSAVAAAAATAGRLAHTHSPHAHGAQHSGIDSDHPMPSPSESGHRPS